MRTLLFFLIPLFSNVLCFAQTKKICITVDDIPAVTYGNHTFYKHSEITQQLIKTFDKFKIPAIGYVVEGQLYSKGSLDSTKIETLEMWLKNGYELGNHTFSHYSYNSVSDSSYFVDILKGETFTKALCKKYNSELQFFRHPYLHTGADSIKNASLKSFLKLHNYREAPITIDTEDYWFAKAYHNAFCQEDYKLMRKIGRDYIKYMDKKLIYFEGKSKEVFDRNITHTLLIHGSLLNAHYLKKLAKMYKRNGYTFVSQQEALNDPAYKTKITSYSKKGDSWIFRWALSNGMPKNILDNDIKTPQYIIDLAKKQ